MIRRAEVELSGLSSKEKAAQALAKDIKVMSARGDSCLDIMPIADDLLLLLEHCKKERHVHNARITMGLVLANQHPKAFLQDVFEQETDEPLRSHLTQMINIGETYEIQPKTSSK